MFARIEVEIQGDSVRFLFIFKLVFITIFSSSCFASQLSKTINEIIKSTGEDLNIGIYVREIGTKNVKFSTHENRKFTPASTTKLFTAYAGLEYLGEDFKYKTVMSADNKVEGGVLQSNIYFRFSGDPTFSYENLKNMMSHIGTKNIVGDLVVNDYLFDHYRTAPGGFTWDDKPFCYAAPKSAVIIDGNCSEAKMWPNNRIGNKANLSFENPDLLKIYNEVETVRPRSQDCPYKSRYLGGNRYEVYGCMFSDKKRPVRLNFALPDNRLMAKRYFEKALKEAGINLRGSITFADSVGKNILYTHHSSPLKDTLVPLLHDSLNPDSSSLFKYLGYKYTGKQGSDESGESMMNRFLRKVGLKKGVILKDGSGESRYNLISPKALVNLLDKAYKSNTKYSFIAAIPKYGSESSLKYRTVSSRFNKYLRAKTGSMRNTSSLAGYYLPIHGKKYVFAIMINGHGLSLQGAKALEDKILNAVLSS